MQLTIFFASLLATMASGRAFVVFEHANFEGAPDYFSYPDGWECYNTRTAFGISSVRDQQNGGGGCTTFYYDKFCVGANWEQSGAAATVPANLNDHILSFRNAC